MAQANNGAADGGVGQNGPPQPPPTPGGVWDDVPDDDDNSVEDAAAAVAGLQVSMQAEDDLQRMAFFAMDVDMSACKNVGKTFADSMNTMSAVVGSNDILFGLSGYGNKFAIPCMYMNKTDASRRRMIVGGHVFEIMRTDISDGELGFTFHAKNTKERSAIFLEAAHLAKQVDMDSDEVHSFGIEPELVRLDNTAYDKMSSIAFGVSDLGMLVDAARSLAETEYGALKYFEVKPPLTPEGRVRLIVRRNAGLPAQLAEVKPLGYLKEKVHVIIYGFTDQQYRSGTVMSIIRKLMGVEVVVGRPMGLVRARNKYHKVDLSISLKQVNRLKSCVESIQKLALENKYVEVEMPDGHKKKTTFLFDEQLAIDVLKPLFGDSENTGGSSAEVRELLSTINSLADKVDGMEENLGTVSDGVDRVSDQVRNAARGMDLSMDELNADMNQFAARSFMAQRAVMEAVGVDEQRQEVMLPVSPAMIGAVQPNIRPGIMFQRGISRTARRGNMFPETPSRRQTSEAPPANEAPAAAPPGGQSGPPAPSPPLEPSAAAPAAARADVSMQSPSASNGAGAASAVPAAGGEGPPGRG